MRMLSSFTMCLLLPACCYGTTLEQVLQVLGAQAQPAGSPGDWARVNQLPGMKWQGPAPKQTPAGYTRYGSLKLEGVGQVTVYFTGDRTAAQQASISLPQGVDKREFTKTLQRLIPSAKVKQLRGGCKDDGEIGGSAVYQIDVSDNASMFAMMMSGTSRTGIDTELAVAKRPNKNWQCPS